MRFRRRKGRLAFLLRVVCALREHSLNRVYRGATHRRIGYFCGDCERWR